MNQEYGRLGGLSLTNCHIGAGTVSATRSPGLGNAENLRESSSLSRSWDLNGQIGDDHDVLIECRDVHKSFGDKKVLKGVSFKIRHGEAVGIIGPSGTGKSTILKVMAGLLAPDKGDVIICGRKRHGLVISQVFGLAWCFKVRRCLILSQSVKMLDSFYLLGRAVGCVVSMLREK